MTVKHYQLGMPGAKRLGGRELKKLASPLPRTSPSAVGPSRCFPRLRVGLSEALPTSPTPVLEQVLAATPQPRPTRLLRGI